MTRNARILATVGVGLALFLAALDQTIVGTALPRIVAELNGLEFYAWVATSYLVASTTLTPIAGKLGDLFGRKPFLLGGMIGFVLASALCGQAQNMAELVAFRGIQGIFGGVLFASVFATIGDLFEPAQRARLQGVFAGIFGVASVVGPTIGGYLTDNLSWRWVFYVNVPVGLLAIAVVFVTLPAVAHKASWRDIDFAGAFTLAATLVPLLIALSITRDHDFSSPEVVGLLLASALMAAIFFVVERRTPHPVVPFDLWKNPTFAVSTVIGFLLGFAMFGAIIFVSLVYQGVLGIPATNAGLLITPLMVGLIASSLVTGQLMVRIRRYRYLGTLGSVVLVLGLWLLAQVNVGTPEIEVVRDLVLVGLGVGVGMPLYLNATQSAVDARYLGVVSSQIQFWRNIGSTVGVAVLGAVLAHELPQKIAAAVPPQLASALQANSSNAQAMFDPAAMQRIPPQLLVAIRGALASATHDVFIIAAVVAGLAVLASLFLQEVPLRGRAERARQPEVEAAPAFGD
ncbi:MAG TPA: MDR family MFS transporter [Candidatus Limnocylindria bacterium]|jgi:EmrB/QacA subfamily drug resistance transporter|nr:MDR family MFS transporter [Candidatus Limnocylindria bacterium]